MRYAFALLALLTLTACESKEERAARHDALCKSYGAKFGTSDYIQCRATLQFSENIKRQADDASLMASASMGLAAGANAGRR